MEHSPQYKETRSKLLFAAAGALVVGEQLGDAGIPTPVPELAAILGAITVIWGLNRLFRAGRDDGPDERL